MRQAIILDVADDLEVKIREFLANEKGGRFTLPIGIAELTIPLMIAIFEEEGWEIEYDFCDEQEWLDFSKQEVKLITYGGAREHRQ